MKLPGFSLGREATNLLQSNHVKPFKVKLIPARLHILKGLTLEVPTKGMKLDLTAGCQDLAELLPNWL